MGMIVTAFVIVLLMYWVFSKKASLSEADAFISPDGQVIEQLARAGSNLSKSHEIEFFFYVPTTLGAKKIESYLKSKNFKVSVQRSNVNNDWALKATKAMIPDATQLVELRREFEKLATAERGTYDGWGTGVVN